ncbi:MAG: SUMF1/EgtB/PvdO family nonheme iron enzyme [Planctomycetota bacterium]|nr:SUMF1/EgtB/PvdO family nonheme iron enzyme [Planctomycetota bacterium]
MIADHRHVGIWGPVWFPSLPNAWWKGNSQGQTQPVGRLSPNAWGLFDMYGNVLEWCEDWYGPYQAGVVSDPRGPSTGLERVLKGGGWGDDGGACRSAFRHGRDPGNWAKYFGFRIARTIAP